MAGGSIELSGLTKRFSEMAVDNIDLTVASGEFFSLLGPSGCGKTTTLRLIAGFEQPTSGRILLDGVDVSDVPPHRRNVNTVFQSYALFPFLDVRDNVAFGLRNRKVAKAELTRRVDEALELVRMTSFAKRRPGQLSGGQQQRVALARALAIEPAVVLLDEPFASLDANLRASVRADVQEIFRRAGTTAVLVTHDQDEALSVADRVAALRDGKIAQYATPEDLYCRPADPELASFVGDANLLEGVLNGGVVKTLLGNLPLDAAAVTDAGTGQVTVLIRPEQIELEPSADGVPGRVTAFGYHGHDAVVHVQPERDADGQTIVVRIAVGSPLAVGSPVNLRARGPVFAWRRD